MGTHSNENGKRTKTCMFLEHGSRVPYLPVGRSLNRWMSPYDWMTVTKTVYLKGNMYFGKLNMMRFAQKQADNNQRYDPTYIVKVCLKGLIMQYLETR